MFYADAVEPSADYRIRTANAEARGQGMRIEHRHPDGSWHRLSPTIPIRAAEPPHRWRSTYLCDCGAAIQSEAPVVAPPPG
jgi:hypothetical protein